VNPALTLTLSLGLIVALLAVAHVPLGTWIYRSFTDPHHWRAERAIYRAVGVDADTEQGWKAYSLSVLAFGVASIAGLWALLMVQGRLPWDFGRSMHGDTAFNTAVSFTTNTNWQSYSPESGTGYTVAMLGLTVQNFVSAGTGLAVAIAVGRGLARASAGRIGNFWVDLTRGTIRILLPLAAVGAVLLLLGGVIQNLAEPHVITTITGAHQTIQGGPVASQEAIKMIGTNGGGFFNANSAHPFENPTAWTNLLEIVFLLVIPFSLPYTYGLLVGDRRQGGVIAGVMGLLFVVASSLTRASENARSGLLGGSMEGKEVRFGPVWSAIFGAATTGTSTGAVNSAHDSFSPLGGAVLLVDMMLGEVSPGGVGTGLYGILIFVVIAGLMVGRTPELLGKTIGRKEVTYAALATLVMPALVLLFTGASLVLPVARGALLNSGPHGLTEMMYAFTSAANNNGSAFAGISADQRYLNLALALCMAVGRFAPIVLVLALAGALAAQQRRPVTSGTLPTTTPLFAGLLIGVILIVAGLTFFPALAMGPIAEALS